MAFKNIKLCLINEIIEEDEIPTQCSRRTHTYLASPMSLENLRMISN